MANLLADFETTGYEQYRLDGEVRVFMWVITDIDTLKVLQRGTDIYDFLEWCLRTRRDKTTNIYFHNLKFDGSFILWYLLYKGWKHVVRFSEKPNKEFTALINEMGVWYGITLKQRKAKYEIRINFRDSFKKIPLSVAQMGKAYNLKNVKLDFDYKKYRPKGYKPTTEEWDYADADTLAVAEALQIHFRQGMTKMTLSSDAYNDLKRRFTKREWDYYFPNLDADMWEDLRKAYKGGYNYTHPNKRETVYHNVLSYDANSMYPDKLRNKPMPYGLPKYFSGKYKPNKSYDLYIQTIEVSFKVKDGYLPTVQTASLGRYTNELFIEDTENMIIELTMTNIDLQIFLEHHEIYYIKYISGYMFKSANDLFSEFIDEHYDKKEHSEGGERQIAKLILNSVYGKFGTNPKVHPRVAVLNDDVLRFEYGEATVSKYRKYIPVAIFTTAYARENLITRAQMFYDNLLYMDTDSIKLHDISEEEVESKLDVHESKLGYWSLDGRYPRFKMLKAKHYAYEEWKNGELKFFIKASGLPNEAKAEITDFNIFKIGFQTKAKLQQRQVKGGVVLIPTIHEIK